MRSDDEHLLDRVRAATAVPPPDLARRAHAVFVLAMLERAVIAGPSVTPIQMAAASARVMSPAAAGGDEGRARS